MVKLVHLVPKSVWTLVGLSVVGMALQACIQDPIGVPSSSAEEEIAVLVVDAETRLPLSGAEIAVHYYPSSPEHPNDSYPTARTDADGVAEISVTTEPGIWHTQASDHIAQEMVGQQGKAPPRYAYAAEDGSDAAIFLYALPEPMLRVQLQEAYSGPVTIQLAPAPGFDFVETDGPNIEFVATAADADYTQGEPGQRVFTTTVSADGQTTIAVTPLLYDIKTEQLQVFDDDGVIPFADPSATELTGRYVWGDANQDNKQLFQEIRLFVGDASAYQDYQSK